MFYGVDFLSIQEHIKEAMQYLMGFVGVVSGALTDHDTLILNFLSAIQAS